MNSDVDAVGLDCPDGSRDKEADLTGEIGILVLLDHLVLQCALDSVEAPGLPGHQDQHVYIWSMDKTIQISSNGPQSILIPDLNQFSNQRSHKQVFDFHRTVFM